MEKEFEPHRIEWTKEKAIRVWDFYSPRRSTFGKKVGADVLNFIRKKGISLEGDILDYGCGPGFLMEKLMAAGMPCKGAEFSPETVEVVTRKFEGNPLFRGVILVGEGAAPIESESFDTVFFMETIEHILPDELESTISEIQRLVRKNGRVVITTPNDEDLEERTVMCPDCGCMFHRVQHMTSWNADSLRGLMEKNGFKSILCEATTFRPGSALNFLLDMGSKLLRRKNPHLIYVGEKE